MSQNSKCSETGNSNLCSPWFVFFFLIFRLDIRVSPVSGIFSSPRKYENERLHGPLFIEKFAKNGKFVQET